MSKLKLVFGAPGLLAVITALGLALRLWGNYWGAPERIGLHPDEHEYVMQHALGMRERIDDAIDHPAHFNRRTLDPVFLNYPGFLMYLIAGVGVLLHRAGLFNQEWQYFVLGRCLVALFGAATAPVAFWLARELGAAAVGALLAALWVALMPLHVWECHAAITDIPMCFFTMLTLVAAVRLVRTGRWRDYAFAGAALGLAVGSKYTAAMAAVAIVFGAVASRRPWRDTLTKLAACGVLSVAVCFLVAPYSFLRLHDTMKALIYEEHHTKSQHYGFSVYAVGWWFRRWIYEVLAGWPFSLGLALYACCAAGTLWTLTRIDRKLGVVLVFCVVFFAVVGSWTFTPLRYTLPVLLPAAVLAGMWQGDWLRAPASPRRRAIAALAVGIAAVYTGIFVGQTTARYHHDTRIEAGHWLQGQAESGKKVYLIGWARYLGVTTGAAEKALHPRTEADLAHMPANDPQALIEITSLHYQRHYRHGNMAYVEVYNRLRDPNGPFELVKRFESHFINKHLYMKLDPMFEGYFVSPTIEIYRGKAAPAAS